jgi:hypothetical protein
VPYDAEAYIEVSGARRQARLTGLTVTSSSRTSGSNFSNKANNNSDSSAADKGAGGVSTVHPPRAAGAFSATKSATTAMPKTVMDAEAMDFRGEQRS